MNKCSPSYRDICVILHGLAWSDSLAENMPPKTFAVHLKGHNIPPEKTNY